MEEIGNKIIELRKKENWSQEQLADKLNVSRQTVSKWETNQAAPSAANIRALCEAFGVQSDYFISADEAVTKPEVQKADGTRPEEPQEDTKKRKKTALIVFLIIFLTIAAVILGVVIVGACCIIIALNKGSSSAVTTQTYPEWYVLIGAAFALVAVLYWLVYLIITRIKSRRKKKNKEIKEGKNK